MIVKDFYEEKGVVAKTNSKRTTTTWVAGGLAILSLIGAYWFFPLLVLAIPFGLLFILMFRERYIEYDYCFSTEEIEVAKIINRKRRRSAIVFDMNNIRFIAPADSERLLNEQELNPLMRSTDHTAVEPSDKVYGFFLDLRGLNTIILLEPTETMMEHLRQVIPNKIYED
ncbi:MAG: hypothetical protein K2N24_11690 [Lachnospiraceae bacterium]|nr:hypothetical protein [Lachnospiraceae bacterium]